MSYDLNKALVSRGSTLKDLFGLISVLQEIDESDPKNESNEWVIPDGNGGEIILSYSPKQDKVILTKNSLKLTLKIENTKAIRKVIKLKGL